MRPRKCRVDSRLRSDRHAEREAAAGAEAWTAVQATAGARIGPHEAHAGQRVRCERRPSSVSANLLTPGTCGG